MKYLKTGISMRNYAYPRHAYRLLPTVLVALFLVPAAAGQEAADSAVMNPYGTGLGAQILLTNHGFGLGGYYHRAVDKSTSLLAEVSIGAGKDEQEFKFFSFGNSYIQYKANYLLMMPIHVGFFHRLFEQNIEDNFRPFVQMTAGPTLGWEYPYFEDANSNRRYDRGERTYDAIGALPKGHLRPGMGGTFGIGAHFGSSKNMTQGVRIGYAFTYFFKGIQLLEPEIQDDEHFFGTPTITLIFGRLL